jgi:hypothetical protein
MRLAILFALVAECTPAPGPVDAGPTPLSDAGSSCSRACARYKQLGCIQAEPTPKGVTCTEVCANAAREGIDLTCGGRAESLPTCDAVMNCN